MMKRAWLIKYRYSNKTRVIWAEYREILPSGAVAFYNADPVTRQATEHIYVAAHGYWSDVEPAGDTIAGTLTTLGEPKEVKRRRDREN